MVDHVVCGGCADIGNYRSKIKPKKVHQKVRLIKRSDKLPKPIIQLTSTLDICPDRVVHLNHSNHAWKHLPALLLKYYTSK